MHAIDDHRERGHTPLGEPHEINRLPSIVKWFPVPRSSRNEDADEAARNLARKVGRADGWSVYRRFLARSQIHPPGSGGASGLRRWNTRKPKPVHQIQSPRAAATRIWSVGCVIPSRRLDAASRCFRRPAARAPELVRTRERRVPRVSYGYRCSVDRPCVGRCFPCVAASCRSLP